MQPEVQAAKEISSLLYQVLGGVGGGGGALGLGVYIVYSKAKKYMASVDKIGDDIGSIKETLVALNLTCAVQSEHMLGLDKRVENLENAPIFNGESQESINKIGQLVKGDMEKDMKDG